MIPGPPPETIASLGEFALLERIGAVLDSPTGLAGRHEVSPRLLLGLGDDAALVRPESGWDWLLTCDTQICGRHFDPRWMDAGAIGRRAMTVNLSDIAAMGGEPRYALVSLGLLGSMEVALVEELYRGFLEALEGTEACIIGGNLARTGPEWFVNITVLGRVRPGRALTRAGASPGDRILVTGSPGRSAAGLAVLRAVTGDGIPGPVPNPHPAIEHFLAASPWARSLIRAFVRPEARVAAGRRLARAEDRSVAALVDISDGLVGDLGHICERSGVRARIDATLLPRDPDLEAAAAHLGCSRAAWTLGPGDDYELLMIVRPASADRVATELRAATGLAVTEIGEILPAGPPPPAPGDKPSMVEVTGLPPGDHHGSGWDHFRGNP
jgi:thiamine-monophosphate kinase